MTIKTVSVRELQHNLAKYLEMAGEMPVLVTKRGKVQAVLTSPKIQNNKDQKNFKNLLTTDFVGMYEDREDWKNMSIDEVAAELRSNSWYGKSVD